MRNINYIILHHSATAPMLNQSDRDGSAISEVICKRARAHWESEFPLYRCDYHFLIGRSGKVFKGQPVELPAWHATNYKVNLESIGVCFIGNFQTGIMPKAQFEAGVALVRKLVYMFDVPIKNVLRHKDVISDITHRANSTLCPGKNFPYVSLLSLINKTPFEDIPPDYKYFKEIEFLKKHGIMEGENGKFNPKAFASREELALVAYRILTKLIN